MDPDQDIDQYAWDLDNEQAAQAVTWMIGLLQEAIREDRRPTAG